MDGTAGTSLRRHMVLALSVVLLLVGALGTTAAVVEISGAVIAPGRVVVETKTKRVQHQEGGIVQAIYVQDGQEIKAGELLVRLDDTLAKAKLGIVITRLRELLAQEARLKAERDEQAQLMVPDALEGQEAEAEVAAALDGQRSLLDARRASRQGRKAQLAEQIKQLQQQIDGLEAQRDAKAEEIKLVASELQDLAGLLQKGLIQRGRVTALKRDKARLEGERGGFISEIAQARQEISERRIQVLQIDEDMRADVVAELQEVRAEIAELTEQRVAAKAELDRLEIRAPRAGFVHQLAVHTVGGVVAPGEDLMLIVPEEDLLVVEAQVAPTDIDQIAPAQIATIRFPSFEQRTTPELDARILTISADLMQDPTTGIAYYQARLALAEDQIARLNGKPLIPGMPVEAFIKTEARTILSYLIKPLSDQIVHAFKEG